MHYVAGENGVNQSKTCMFEYVYYKCMYILCSNYIINVLCVFYFFSCPNLIFKQLFRSAFQYVFSLLKHISNQQSPWVCITTIL